MTTLTLTDAQATVFDSLTSNEKRIVELMGAGHPPVVVASTLGLSESRISQVVAQAEVAELIAQLRYAELNKYQAIDAEYDSLESALQKKFRKVLPLMIKPEQILRGLQTINAAKRRSVAAPESATQSSEIVSIRLPASFSGKFAVAFDADGRATKAGDQHLLTAQLSALPKLAENIKVNQNDTPAKTPDTKPDTVKIARTGSALCAEDF